MSSGEKIDDGGSAFPTLPPLHPEGGHPDGYPYPQDGMSLRQWYAGLAMQGLLASGPHDCGVLGIALDAVQQADALIKALKGRPS